MSRAFPAGRGCLARDVGGRLRAGRGAAGAAGGRDRRTTARLMAPACGRDDVAGVRAPRTGPARRSGGSRSSSGRNTVCFVMDPSRSGAVLARHAGIDEKTGQLTGDRGRRTAAAGHLQRLLQGLRVRREEGRRPGEPVLLGSPATAHSAGRGREPRPAEGAKRASGSTGSGTFTTRMTS